MGVVRHGRSSTSRIGGRQQDKHWYCPPELASVRFVHDLGNPGIDTIASAPSFDVWSFGVVAFELCAGRTLFAQDTANDELVDEADRTRLCTWLCISDEELAPVLSVAEFGGAGDMRQAVVDDAKNPIRWCLQKDTVRGRRWQRSFSTVFFVLGRECQPRSGCSIFGS